MDNYSTQGSKVANRTVRHYIREFFKGDSGFSSSDFADLLSEPYSLVIAVFEQLSYAAGHTTGATFPKQWSSLAPKSSLPTLSSEHLALRWSLIRLSLASSVLSPQLTARDVIESMFIVGDPDESQTALNNFEDQFGLSLWSLAMRFRIAEIAYGTGYNRTEVERFIESNRSSAGSRWINFLAAMFSSQAERDLPTSEYAELTRFLDVEATEQNTYALTYLRYRLRSLIPVTGEAIADLLRFENSHAIIDVHDTLVNVLGFLNALELDSLTSEYLLDTTHLVGSPMLSVAASRHVSPVNARADADDVVSAAISSFRGDYHQAIHYALRSISTFPRHFCGYQLLGHALAQIGRAPPSSTAHSGIQTELLTAIVEWHSTEGNRTRALEQLRRLGRRYRGMLLGWGIDEYTQSLERGADVLSGERISFVASPVMLPQHLLDLAGCGATLQRVRHLAVVPDNFVREGVDTLLGIRSIDFENNQGSDQDTPRPLHIRAIAAALSGKFAICCDALATLRNRHPHYYAVRPDAQLLESHCLICVNEVEEAATLAARLYCRSRGALPPSLLAAFSPYIHDQQRTTSPHNIAWPILAAVLYEHNDPNLTLDRVHDFVSDYIEGHGFVRPTELLEAASGPVHLEMYVFLRDCCTVDIMESSIWIGSQEELLRERLSLCEAIRRDMDEPPIGIEGEIATLMRKLAVLDITSRIERSKVFVDTGRIKDRTSDQLSDSTHRLLAMVAFNNKDVQRGLKLIGMPNRDGGKTVVVTFDRGLEMFTNIFQRLREQYLFSPELGLDANLSQSIRHGPIISGIRAIFDRYHLVARTTSTGEYERNSHWMPILSGDAINIPLLERAFSQLASDVDSFARTVREKEVQIVNDELPSAMFNFDFSERDMEHGLKQLDPLLEKEDVYDVMLGMLVSRTEHCLAEIRRRIVTEWCSHLTTLLTVLQEQVEAAVRDSHSLRHLKSVITDCKTDLPRSLDKIAEWFKHEDRRENRAFALSSLVRSFEQIAAKSALTCTVGYHELGTAGEKLVAGAYFRPLWDMFFTVFDNALKHGEPSSPAIEVAVQLCDDTTEIEISNDISKSADANALLGRLEHLNGLQLDTSANLLKLRSEGGSGIAKLHKIVRYEIGQDCIQYKITLTLNEQRRFSVRIYIEKGILDADLPS